MFERVFYFKKERRQGKARGEGEGVGFQVCVKSVHMFNMIKILKMFSKNKCLQQQSSKKIEKKFSDVLPNEKKAFVNGR